MTTEKIGGSLPESNKPTPKSTTSTGSHKKIEKVEKIKETSETELDQQRKKFRRFVDEPPEETDSSLPTPLNLFQDQRNNKNIAPSNRSIRSDNSNRSSSTRDSTQDSPSPLPRSKEFWSHSDEPPDVVSKEKPHLQEKGKKKTGEEPYTMDPMMQLPQIETPMQKGVKTKDGKLIKEPDAKHPAAVPLISPMQHPTQPKIAQSTFQPSSPTTPQTPHSVSAPKAPIKQPNSGTQMLKKQGSIEKKGIPAAPIKKKEDEEEQGNLRPKQSIQSTVMPIDLPSQTPLPQAAANFAQTATAPLTPYLNPQILPVFYQMVGTIFMMASPRGDSHTEFLLNAPSFAKSQFYGAKITIERFATAPDTFNIRLTGSNAAVTAFNQNIPTLLAAFQKGNFSFAVHRIEAAYEKPLFHRKKKAGSDDLGQNNLDQGST